jgi:hypothetical protein
MLLTFKTNVIINVRFEGLAAMTVKGTFFWDVMLLLWKTGTNISEEPTALQT